MKYFLVISILVVLAPTHLRAPFTFGLFGKKKPVECAAMTDEIKSKLAGIAPVSVKEKMERDCGFPAICDKKSGAKTLLDCITMQIAGLEDCVLVKSQIDEKVKRIQKLEGFFVGLYRGFKCRKPSRFCRLDTVEAYKKYFKCIEEYAFEHFGIARGGGSAEKPTPKELSALPRD